MEVKKSTLLWVIIGVMLLSVIFLTYKVSTIGPQANNGQLDTSTWTANEKMNYEMHGTVPARFQGKISPQSSSPGGGQMVGGC